MIGSVSEPENYILFRYILVKMPIVIPELKLKIYLLS